MGGQSPARWNGSTWMSVSQMQQGSGFRMEGDSVGDGTTGIMDGKRMDLCLG